MKPAFALSALISVVGSVCAAEIQLNGYTFQVPDGFSIELVADQPLVTYPICADFDEQGRLYVAEASGARDWNKPQPHETRHRMLRLEDTDGDGRFDKRTVFATFDMLAQGSMWHNGSLYVAATPIIWKLTDEDGDGVAERREKWIETKEMTGCLNDLRGPYLGPDGWIYWSKGPAQQTYQVGGKPWSTTARHILRRHPDRQEVEQVMVGGMDNVVEVAFSRGGERFVTNTNIQMVGQPRKDGILHAVYGGVYPKDILPVYGFPWSGPRMMPELTSWGAMSPCGLTRYESSEFGAQYRDNLFTCLFSGHKVLRHVLQPDGATFSTRDEDFLACDDVQFHPTDVLEDADGSLLVIETGGWYLHCCPSSTFYRPDKHGAIYRIRRNGSHQIDDPRGQKLNWGEPTPQDLAKRLADRRPAVTQRAVNRLGQLEGSAIPVLRNVIGSSTSADARCHAVWAATRVDHQSSRDAVRLALNDADETVRHAALSSVSLWRDEKSVPRLLEILRHPSAQNRRAAAEALGRIGDASAVGVLLNALSEPADRFLEHSLTFALIEIGDPKLTQLGLAANSVHTRRAAMIALDQISGVTLDPLLVMAQLDSSDVQMQETAWWLTSRHPREWGGLLGDKLRVQVSDGKLNGAERQALATRLGQVARTPGVADWIATELTRSGASANTQILLLKSMADTMGNQADTRWIKAMLGLLTNSEDAAVVSEAVAALRKQPRIRANTEAEKQLYEAFNTGLRQTGQRSDLQEDTRLAALSGIRGDSIGGVDDELFAFLLTKIGPDEPFSLRAAAADMLSRSLLTDPQLLRLSGSMKNLAAPELNLMLGLFEDHKSDAVGQRLVASLQGSAATLTLNAFRLKNCLAGFGNGVQEQARPLFERLEQAQAQQLAKAHRIMKLAPDADPHRGMQVFHSNKAACNSCHKTQHVGSTIGPHLRGIGQRRTERDFIESILFPSASLVQSYESWTVVTTNGRVVSGVIQKDTPDELVLSAGPDKTARIPRDAIEGMTRSNVSIMPEGLDKSLTEQQLADLVSYLKSLQ
jgi:putative heme-binding domain-containing protein